MKSINKIVVTLSLGLLLSPSLSSFSVVYANENASVYTEELVSESVSVVGIDGETLVEILDHETLRLTYSDGSIDLLEKRADGVYKNGQLFISNSQLEASGTSFRSAGWTLVSSSSGRADRDSAVASAMSWIYGAALGLVGGGPIGALIGAVSAFTPSNPPGAYSRRWVYYNAQSRQFKVVVAYYRNSNFTGYVTTTTNYLNVPA